MGDTQTQAISVNSVTYHEDGRRTVDVQCSCGLMHTIEWPKNRKTIGKVEMDCGREFIVEVPDWAHDSTYRTYFGTYLTARERALGIRHA
jgi:hypothetical protein